MSAPVIGLVVAVFVLILLVLRTKVHPLIAMIVAACIAGVAGGMSVNSTLDSIVKGFGTTLGTIGIVIGLGVMMGRILEVSGAGEQIAYSFIAWLGKRKEDWAMAMTGYIVSIPIFVDSAFVILYPIAKALAKKGQRSLLTMGIALAGGLVVTHTTVPPTPGPLGAAGIFGVDVGSMMIAGLLLAVPCVIGIVIYARWLEDRYPAFILNEASVKDVKTKDETDIQENNDKQLPGLMLSLLPIVVPILLICIKALINLLPEGYSTDVEIFDIGIQLFSFLGAPIIAMCISTVIAVYTLVPYLDRQKTSARLEEGLQSAGIILLVTGAGGALGTVVRDSGAGNLLAGEIAHLPVSPVMIPFFVATAVRLIQGSGTVACITSASITAPILAQIPDINLLFAAQSAVMGAFCFSYFNDSLFWVVNRMMGITDLKKQIVVWSIPTTIAWGIGGVTIALVNLILGAGGTLFDPLLPLLILIIILVMVRKRSV